MGWRHYDTQWLDFYSENIDFFEVHSVRKSYLGAVIKISRNIYIWNPRDGGVAAWQRTPSSKSVLIVTVTVTVNRTR